VLGSFSIEIPSPDMVLLYMEVDRFLDLTGPLTLRSWASRAGRLEASGLIECAARTVERTKQGRPFCWWQRTCGASDIPDNLGLDDLYLIRYTEIVNIGIAYGP
jgi:hypothetical protein